MYLNRVTLIGFIGNDAEKKVAGTTNIAIFTGYMPHHGSLARTSPSRSAPNCDDGLRTSPRHLVKGAISREISPSSASALTSVETLVLSTHPFIWQFSDMLCLNFNFCMRLLSLFCIVALQAGIAADLSGDDRDVALWVFRKGGRVRVDGTRLIPRSLRLARKAFRIAGVDMHGTVVDPKDMEPLGRLPELQEALLPARVWSPTFDIKSPFGEEMFDYFANSKKLVKFEAGLTTFAYLRLGEPGLKRLKPNVQLKDMRVSLVTIKNPETLAPFVNMETLDLNDANIMDEMMPGLAGMKKLRRLTMVGTLVTDEGLKYLRDLQELEELDLYGVKITDAGVQHLSGLTKLRRLNLLGAQITDASADDPGAHEGTARAEYLSQPLHQRGTGQARRIARTAGAGRPLYRYHRRRRGGVQRGVADVPRGFCQQLGAFRQGAGQGKAGGNLATRAVTAWIESLGGNTRVTGGRIASISLARVRVHRCPGSSPAVDPVCRAAGPRGQRSRRPEPRCDRPHDIASRPQSQLHVGLGPRAGQTGAADPIAPAESRRLAGGRIGPGGARVH